MIDTNKILAAAVVGHLLEFIDTGEELDLAAAMNCLKQSDLPAFAKENPVMIPLRRDHRSQAQRFLEES